MSKLTDNDFREIELIDPTEPIFSVYESLRAALDKYPDDAGKASLRPRVFCASLADVFEDWQGQVSHSSGIPMWQMHQPNGHAFSWGVGRILDDPESGFPLRLSMVRYRLFDLIDATPYLDWLLLTKRPENIMRMLIDAGRGFQDLPSQIWMGTSVENQEQADKRIPELLKVPAKVRFLSVEPLLGPVNILRYFTHSIHCNGYRGSAGFFPSFCDCGRPNIHWVIIGGESGSNARKCNIEWIRNIVRQCQSVGVPVFVKQLGSNSQHDHGEPIGWPERMRPKDPKGGNPEEWPEDLRVRESPK